jgi:hypothetical protein
MMVSGRLNAPISLIIGEDLLVPKERGLVGLKSCSGRVVEENVCYSFRELLSRPLFSNL